MNIRCPQCHTVMKIMAMGIWDEFNIVGPYRALGHKKSYRCPKCGLSVHMLKDAYGETYPLYGLP